MNTPQVSVIIPTYQRCAPLKRALQALDAQTLEPAGYEVIVAVDGSDDGTREMLAAYRPGYALETIYRQNGGRASACNAGIYAARGSLVVLLDDDMEAEPQLLQEHVNAHAGARRLGVVGASPIEMRAGLLSSQKYVAVKFNEHLARLAAPGYEMKLRDFYSGNFSIRREILLEVGAFDPEFKIYGNEDLELAVRLMQAGVTLAFRVNARARQHYTKDIAGLARDHRSKGKTSIQLANKHPETFSQLKHAHPGDASWGWRTARRALLEASRVFPGTPNVVIKLLQLTEQRRLPLPLLFYARALDYFYWLGVAEMRAAGISAARSQPPVRPVEVRG